MTISAPWTEKCDTVLHQMAWICNEVLSIYLNYSQGSTLSCWISKSFHCKPKHVNSVQWVPFQHQPHMNLRDTTTFSQDYTSSLFAHRDLKKVSLSLSYHKITGRLLITNQTNGLICLNETKCHERNVVIRKKIERRTVDGKPKLIK